MNLFYLLDFVLRKSTGILLGYKNKKGMKEMGWKLSSFGVGNG